MAATVRGEGDEDNSISMRLTLFGIRKTFPKVKQLDTCALEKFIQENEYKNLVLLVSKNSFNGGDYQDQLVVPSVLFLKDFNFFM
jgi:hypothetical protein